MTVSKLSSVPIKAPIFPGQYQKRQFVNFDILTEKVLACTGGKRGRIREWRMENGK
jgi:hypothetical protein